MTDPTYAAPPITAAPTGSSTAAGLALLADGVPLTLLLDLALAVDSRQLYRDEPADVRWVHSLTG